MYYYTLTWSELLVVKETAKLNYTACPTELHSDAATIDCIPIIDQIDIAVVWPLCSERTLQTEIKATKSSTL